MVFSLSALWWRRIRGLWKLPDGRDWLRGKLSLVLMGGALLNKSLIQFFVDGWSCVPPLLFSWGQTMVEVMKIMMTSFKKSHAGSATLSAPNPEAGHHWPTPLLETPGHTQASLGQSLVGSLLLSPGSWCTRFCCALWGSISQSCLSSGSSMVRLMATSSKRFYAIPKSAASRALSLWQSTADPYLHRDAQTQFCLSLCGGLWVLVCTRFVWALLASLAGMGFDSKCKFAPPTILLGLLLCPWTWSISSQPFQSLPHYWGFSDLGCGVSPLRGSLLQHTTPAPYAIN